MILASGARGPGFNSQNSPNNLPDDDITKRNSAPSKISILAEKLCLTTMLVREDGKSLADFVSLEFMSCQCFEGSSYQLVREGPGFNSQNSPTNLSCILLCIGSPVVGVHCRIDVTPLCLNCNTLFWTNAAWTLFWAFFLERAIVATLSATGFALVVQW